MRRGQLIRFSIALAAEIVCAASLNFFDDWTLEAMPVKFVAAAMLCGIAYFCAVTEFRVVKNPRAQAIVFWLVVVVLRLVALPLAPGDDLWRYQWEGKIQRAGFNPYVNAPDDPAFEGVRQEFPNWQKINHRDFRAIYPPGAELLFRALSGISDDPVFYKLLFAGADIATIGVLLLLLGGPTRYAQAAWYGWNPLAVYSFAGAVHFDSLMILPMTAGILFLVRTENATSSRTKWLFAFAASVAFGIAISMKLVPVLLLLACIFALRLRAVTLVVSVGIPWLLSLLYGYPKIPIWESLGRFAHVTRLNDLFWWLIEETVWPNPHQRSFHYYPILIVSVIAVSFLFVRNWKRGMLWALGVVVVLSPILHPWYCVWILPLAAWRSAYAWNVLSVTLFSYYLFWDERLFGLPWHAEPWMRGLIIAPVLAGLVMLGAQKKTAVEAT